MVSDRLLEIQLEYIRELYTRLPDDLDSALLAVREDKVFRFKAFGRPCAITPEGIRLSGQMLTGGMGIIIALYARHACRDEVQLSPPKAFAQIEGSRPHQEAFRARTEQSLVPYVGDIKDSKERIVQAFSSDHGQTWTGLEASSLPNNNSGIEALTLADGRHLLLYNHLSGEGQEDGWGKRNVLNLAISEDGREWKAAAIIEREEQGEFSYPAMIQTADGLVHMTYTWNRRRVKHVVIDPAKLEVGGVVGLGPWGTR